MTQEAPTTVSIQPVFPRGVLALPGTQVFYHDPRLQQHRQPRSARVSGYGSQAGTVHLHVDLCPVLDAGRGAIITAKNIRLLKDYPGGWPNEPFCVLPSAEAGGVGAEPSTADATGGNQTIGLDADLALGNLPGKQMPSERTQPLQQQGARSPGHNAPSRAMNQESVQVAGLQTTLSMSQFAAVEPACDEYKVTCEIMLEDASNPQDVVPAAMVFTNQHGLIIAQLECDDSGTLTLLARATARRDMSPVQPNITSEIGVATAAGRIIQIAQACRNSTEHADVLQRTVQLVRAWNGSAPMPVFEEDEPKRGTLVQAGSAGTIDIDSANKKLLTAILDQPPSAGKPNTKKKPGK
jgi:hypothetical protein